MTSNFSAKKHGIRSLFFVMLFSSLGIQLIAQTSSWNTVRIGGTGNVTSIKAHPAVPNLYFATTDVGNPYRWNHTAQRWEGLLNALPLSQWNNAACENLAVDPNDLTGNILYATVGKYSDSIGKVIKSTDRGTTWKDAGLRISCCANGASRSGGDRISVDPQNSTVVFVTSYAGGTYKGLNGGTTWSKVNDLNGTFVAFEISGGKLSGVSKNIWIGTSAGVYLSTNGGNTFALSGSNTVNAKRASIHRNGTMYVATSTGISKWNGRSWSIVSPISGSYHGVSVNPNNSNEVIVALDSWDSPKYRSNDGGATWTLFSNSYDVTEVPYVTFDHFAKKINDFAWDPFNKGQVWLSDIFQIYQTTNIWSSPVEWKVRAAGEEEFVTTGAMVCPPVGSPNLLLSCGADLGGFDHKSLTCSPSESMVKYFPWVSSTSLAGNMTGVAVQQSNPNFIARVGRHGWGGTVCGGYSTDGNSYTTFKKYPTGESGGRIVIAATSETMLWATQGSFTYRSTNRGEDWTKISSIPTSIVPGTTIFDGSYPNPLAADKVNGNKFYIYHAGKFYVSSDAGITFTATVSNLPVISSASLLQVVTSPDLEGDIWLSLPGSGLYHSNNSGSSFTQIKNVQDVRLMAVGKSDANFAIYVMGKVNKISDGVFRSLNNGITWEQIDTPTHKMGNEPNTMAADQYGRVFIGTNGNGIFVYGNINAGSVPKVAPATTIAVYKVEQFGAKADSITNNTNAIQAAIDECSSKGGGKVEFAEGVYLSGGLILKNNVTLSINTGCTLKAVADTSEFKLIQSSVISRMDVVPWKAFIRADSQHNIRLCGGGTIDASGDAQCFRNGIDNSPNRPYGLFFVNCKDVSVENLKLQSSAFWMQRYFSCSRVRVRGLDVYNHVNQNNDGIDIDSSNDVMVSDCNIDSSDDAICIKSEGERPAKNIVITNCIVATHASAIKLGTGSVGGFENICISNIVIHRSISNEMRHGLGVWGGLSGIDIATTDGGALRQVQISNICMEDVQNPIHIRLGNRLSGNVARQGYGDLFDKSQGVKQNGKSTKITEDLVLEDVIISNVLAKNVGSYPVIIAGHEGHPVKRITLRDITIRCGVAGTQKDVNTQVNWKANGYPGRGMYNSCLPVYGLITNFTEGLVIENFHVIPAKGEVRQKETHLNRIK